jgi:hypothetical protein
MKRMLVLLIAIPLPASAKPVAEFRHGDTVCFVGDSITRGGLYHSFIQQPEPLFLR